MGYGCDLYPFNGIAARRQVTRDTAPGKVTILIPARNEEFNLPGCLLSAVFTSAVEIIVCDDESDDGTAHVVRSSMQRYDRIRLIEAGPLPDGWTGRAHACHKLAAAANTEWLLFLDAGLRISAQAVERLVAEAEAGKWTWLACRPELERPTFAQAVIDPALHFLAFTQGGCTLVHRATYELLGGYATVAGEVDADLALAREWRKRGERAGCFDDRTIVKDTRRADFPALWTTLRRHAWLAFPGAPPFAAVCLAALITAIPWWPVFTLVVSLRLVHALRFRQPLWSAFLHPAASLFLLAAGLASFAEAHSKRGIEWKGRWYRPG